MAGSQRLLHRPDARVSLPQVSARAVRGELRLRAEMDSRGHTVLTERVHRGAFHLSKSYWDGQALLVQWVNPTAGIFAGDVLKSDVQVDAGASLLVTTPSATRIHTRMDANHPPGEQQQHFSVASGGCLEVQPEWLIPQRGSAFVQRTSIEVEQGGTLFYAELLAPGRMAHGEALEFESLDLRTRLVVGGQLVSQERLFAGTKPGRWMLQSTTGKPMFAATVWLVLPQHGEEVSKAIRLCLESAQDWEAGMTVLSGDVIGIRLLAVEGRTIRKLMRQLRAVISATFGRFQTDMRKL